MTTYLMRVLGLALVIGVAVSATACDSFLDVPNRGSLEAEAIDPESDARLLGQSVYQQFISNWRFLPVYIAWYTSSAWVGDTYPTRNDFGRRDIPWTNGHIGSYWSSFAWDLQFSRSTINAIKAAGNTLDLARAYFVSGFTLVHMAETFCEGTIADHSEKPPVPRGPMSTIALLDSAIVDLQQARTVAQGVSGADATAAANVAMAAQVGIARAHLQAGRRAEAAAAAAQVPAGFVYELWHLDDSSNRALGNGVWSFSEARISLVTPPAFRAMADAGDPRIAYVDMGRVAQDGTLRFYRQNKYKGWGDNERFASGLEARYIKVEADQNAAAMLAFVNERRAVGKQDPLPATSDLDLLMWELMEQKGRDFWLEGKSMGDLRRVGPDRLPYLVPAGQDTYYKPALGEVIGETCWPVPRTEYLNNPHFPMP